MGFEEGVEVDVEGGHAEQAFSGGLEKGRKRGNSPCIDAMAGRTGQLQEPTTCTLAGEGQGESKQTFHQASWNSRSFGSRPLTKDFKENSI